jgi:DtxR family Mn-dependent transcriptional regulator
MQATDQRPGQATEDYLKAIYRLEEKGRTVSTSSLSEVLGVSPPAVTKAIRQLSRKGLVRYVPYKGVALADAGRAIALEIVRHHRLIETFLHQVLGYSWDEVDAEAERLEHHISEKFEAAIDKLLDYPRFDPHGDPIPRMDGRIHQSTARSLTECKPGDRVEIVRVRDRHPDALQYLGRLAMRVGAVLDVIEKQPFQGPITLRINDQQRAIGRELAGLVFVKCVKTGQPAAGAINDPSPGEPDGEVAEMKANKEGLLTYPAADEAKDGGE